MSDIPQARKRLKALIKKIEAMTEQLEAIANEAVEIESMMYKKFIKLRAPTSSVKWTPELSSVVAAFALRNPHMSSQMVADIFQVNPGRVTQALQENGHDA